MIGSKQHGAKMQTISQAIASVHKAGVSSVGGGCGVAVQKLNETMSGIVISCAISLLTKYPFPRSYLHQSLFELVKRKHKDESLCLLCELLGIRNQKYKFCIRSSNNNNTSVFIFRRLNIK